MQTAKPFSAYFISSAGRDLAQAIVKTCSWDPREIHPGGLAAAGRLADVGPLAHLVMVEMGKMPLEAACQSVAEITRFGSEVVVLGREAPEGAFRQFRRAGAEDFFTFPVKLSDVLDVVRRRARLPVSSAPPQAMVVGVTGARGGAGTSLVAENLAFAAARDSARSVALIDLDFHFGSLAIDLNRDFTAGLFEALSGPDRVDKTFLDSSMAEIRPNLRIYSTQAGLDQDIAGYEQAIGALVARMASLFDVLVLDIPRDLAARQPDVLSQCRRIVVAMPPGFSGLNGFSRLAAHCSQHAPEAEVVPVLSSAREDARLSRKDLSKALKTDLRHVLPRCDAHIAKAHQKGQALGAMFPRAPYSKAIQTLWAELDPTRPDSPRPRGFRFPRRAADNA